MKANRARCGLNQESLGKMIGLSASTYASKENGKIIFTLEEAFTITQKLNLLLAKKGYEKVGIEKLFAR